MADEKTTYNEDIRYNDAAFELFFKEQFALLCAWCRYKFGFDPDTAKDIVHTAFIQLWKNRHTLLTGVTNRIQYKKFMAGLDLLYVFNMGDYSGITTNDRQDALSIRNVYAGYQLQLKNRPLEVYIATRNPVQPHNTVLPDKRTFWGAGFKVGL